MRTGGTEHLHPDVKWESLLRFRLIEIVSLWEGQLTTRHLMSTFGIKRQQASRDINAYKDLAPGNIEYLPARKGYTPTTRFVPRFTEGTVDEYLNMVDSRGLVGSALQQLAMLNVATYPLRAPGRLVQPAVVRPIVDACRRGQRLEVTYASMSTPEGEERIIAPHALVSSGYRWHARAYCEKNRDYRDFLLGRVLEISDALGPALVEPINDSLWQNEITLRLIPHPDLSEAQQGLVRYERCFEGDVLELTTREATAIYLLHMLQVPTRETRNSKANTLVLEDVETVAHLLFQ